LSSHKNTVTRGFYQSKIPFLVSLFHPFVNIQHFCGYIILPIGIPADMTPEEALKDNDRYRVVWQVLQALRAHDDRFNAIINKLELNKNRPPQIDVIGVGGGGEDGEDIEINETLSLNWPEIKEWKEAIYAKIVQKCGDRRYWEDWAKDVATIADRHTSRIKGILAKDVQLREQFNQFVHNLQAIINPSIKENDAIEMLSQHLITKPVFDAIFSDYEFTKYNPISVAMQKMIDVLEGQSLAKETEKLDAFYASVKTRASGIDNAEGRQKLLWSCTINFSS
jgi:predicted helicase